METSAVGLRTAERAQRWTLTLADEIGPRRPCSRAEATAAEWLRAELAEADVEASIEPFPAYASFAAPSGVLAGAAVAAGLLPRRAQPLRNALALTALAIGALEDGLTSRPLSRVLARAESRNVVATIEPREAPIRTVCLVSHLDTSRSGWLFSPPLAPYLRRLVATGSLALAVQGAEPLLARARLGRGLAAASRGVLALGLLLLAERELRGEDVPGANDNASGAAVTAALAAEIAEAPLESTRVVLLATGAEEAGLLGADAFVRGRDTRDWLFVNFDGVAAPATLRYLPREGVVRTWPADPGLLRVVERLSRERPELGLREVEIPAGLTYDATVVLARGGRGLTISAQDGTIPAYHQPSDDATNIDADTLERVVEIGRELIAAIDSGDAD